MSSSFTVTSALFQYKFKMSMTASEGNFLNYAAMINSAGSGSNHPDSYVR